ncbi:hypothetical protein LOD99_6504 [Oopsacas minuta]|uniref:Pyridoxal-dependent decarboxylase domain-containing protein 1 n=1 Tax=Oopsacas minuta TaxID=111878 RepID=A0AAV7JMG5_9METZ|nr:hypothetical protein LOD99_6504 [Oopsacas minuta]
MSGSPAARQATPPPGNTDAPNNELYVPSELYKQVNRFLERFFDPSPVPIESKVDLSRLMSAIPFETILNILYIYFCPEGETHPDTPNPSLRAGGTQLGAVVSTLVPYVSVAYDIEQLDHVVGRVSKECSEWIREMICLPDFTGTLFHSDTRCIGGLGKIAQLALHQRYPALYEEGPATLVSNPPVIYISPAAPEHLELQLAISLSIGRNSIVRLPPVTIGCPIIDVDKFEEIIAKHNREGRRPLLLLAYLGTPDTGHTDNFSRLSCVCSLENIWLHLAGISLSNLVLSHRQNLSSLTSIVTQGNSLTLDIGLWFGLPTLPNVTLYKENDAVISNRDIMHKLIGLKNKQEYLLPIVVWTTILSIGRKGLISTVDYAMGIATAIIQGLCDIHSIKLISPEHASFMIRFGYKGPPFLLKRGNDTTQGATEEPTQYLPVEITNDFFDVISESLLPDFPTLNLIEGPETNELRYFTIDVYHCFTQLGAGLEEVDKFIKKLKLITEELDATLYTRVKISKHFHKDINLSVKEVKGRTSTACIHYMPTKLVNSPALRPEQITELNKANRKLATHMSGKHHAYGYCVIQDYVYVELGRIKPGEQQDVLETFNEIKEQANQLDVDSDQLEVLSEQVAAVLSNAQAELVEEQDRAFWDEGLIRKVPLIGSVVNWWSPYNPQPTGRSFNFISGKMEPTAEVYKNKAQLTTDETGLSLADSSLISASSLSIASKTGSVESPLKEKPEP